MTREEAIKTLRELWRETNDSWYEEAYDLAIEALSAEGAVWNEYEAEFTDLPDIPRYYYEKVVGKMAHEINMLKEQLESADAEWIPIATEPNTSDHVLVTYKWDGDDYEVSELDYWVTEYEAEKGNEECKWLIDHVTAWMPLPTPYKGGDTE